MQVLIVILALAGGTSITATTQDMSSAATCNAARERIAADLKQIAGAGVAALVYCVPK